MNKSVKNYIRQIVKEQEAKEGMTVLELSTLCVLLEKYNKSLPYFKETATRLYGDISMEAIKKMSLEMSISLGEASKRFYDMCEVQKLGGK